MYYANGTFYADTASQQPKLHEAFNAKNMDNVIIPPGMYLILKLKDQKNVDISKPLIVYCLEHNKFGCTLSTDRNSQPSWLQRKGKVRSISLPKTKDGVTKIVRNTSWNQGDEVENI